DARVDLEDVGRLHADAAVRDEAAAQVAAVRRAEVVDGAVDAVVAEPREERQAGKDRLLDARLRIGPPELARLDRRRRDGELVLARRQDRVQRQRLAVAGLALV